MPSKRESIYRCVFSSPGLQRVAHVRAWDADEAAELFQTELRADGYQKRGAIEVTLSSRARNTTTCAAR